jgi:hypothetical protein
MAIIRLILGRLILLLNWVFTPKSIQREAGQQSTIDSQTALLTEYKTDKRHLFNQSIIHS